MLLGGVRWRMFSDTLQDAKDNSSLPEHLSAGNAKPSLKSDIIEWFVKKKLGWETAVVTLINHKSQSVVQSPSFRKTFRKLLNSCGNPWNYCAEIAYM